MAFCYLQFASSYSDDFPTWILADFTDPTGRQETLAQS